MGFKTGIVGLPNVGKSTLFNALTQTAAAQAANFPFCTIEPNVGEVAVPDARLDKLAEIAKSQADHPDPDDLRRYRGAGEGRVQGRGPRQPVPRQHPRSATPSPMCCAASRTTTSPMSRAASIPIADAETIETELMLADLESIEKRLQGLVRKVRGGDKEAVQQERLLKRGAGGAGGGPARAHRRGRRRGRARPGGCCSC